MLADYQDLKNRLDIAAYYKNNWLAQYQDVFRYVLPNRNSFNVLFNYRDDGLPASNNIWNDTPVLAANQRANDLHSLLMPEQRRWGKAILNPRVVDQDSAAAFQPALDEITDKIFEYINQSNLSRAAASSLLDLNVGTAGLWIESKSDNEPLYFTSIPGLCIFIEQNTDDIVNNAWYCCQKSGRQILNDFPKYAGRHVVNLRESKDDLFTIYYGQIKLGPEAFLIYATLEADPDCPLFERISEHKQLIVYRDHVRPGEADGRGIAIDMLPTIRDLNHMCKDVRASTAFKGNPMLFVDSNAYFDPYAIRQTAGAILKKAPGGPVPIQALQLPDMPPEVWQQIKDMEQKIQQGFLVDPLGDLNTPVRTAEEVSIREDRAQRTSVTDISRLINELPKQVFEICAQILQKRSLLPTLKVGVRGQRGKLDKNKTSIINQAVRFEYISPLIELQNQQDIQNFSTMMQMMQQYFGEETAVVATNLGDAVTFLVEKLNLPTKLFKGSGALKRAYKQILSASQQNPQLTQPTSASITPSNIQTAGNQA